MSRSWAKGSSTKWRRVRGEVLVRDAYQCQVKLPGVCTKKATQVHHTKGRSLTGDNPIHLVACCRECNLAIGDPTRQMHDPHPNPRTDWSK